VTSVAVYFAVAGLPILSFQLAAQDRQSSVTYRNTAPGVRYVGTSICATCHPQIANRYSGTAMGRSMTRPGNRVTFSEASLPFKVFDSEANEYFEVSQQGGRLIQSQYATDHDGKEVFRQDWEIAYVIGSGENGVSFVIQREGYLFEAPLSYYAKSHSWGFSPGYERHNYGFARPVIAECTGCHSGRPQPVYGFEGRYRNPAFAELAVGCENCHGPGGLHVAERRAALRPTGSIDTSIVNPAHLSGWLSDNICMKCHQAGDVRVSQPLKHSEDFRPGTELNNVLAIFKVTLHQAENSPPDVLLEHYYSMTLSKCYRSSTGALRCTTCHDPHEEASKTQSADLYRTKCLGCHDSRPCKLVVIERKKTNPPDNCAACHMPKRAAKNIAHAALTEHRIVRTSEEPFPESAFHASTQVGSHLIEVTATPEAKSPPDITLFKAYATLVHEGHDELRSPMNELLDRLSQTAPNDPIVLSARGRREAISGAPEMAISDFKRAIAAGSTDRADFVFLAELYSGAHKNRKAIETLQLGMAANPYSPEFPESIAAQFLQLDDYRNASKVIREGLERFPDDSKMRALDRKVLSVMPDPN
jgi:predicted CXXCH cytochrome family protein